jgi:hypothetical protein
MKFHMVPGRYTLLVENRIAGATVEPVRILTSGLLAGSVVGTLRHAAQPACWPGMCRVIRGKRKDHGRRAGNG